MALQLLLLRRTPPPPPSLTVRGLPVWAVAEPTGTPYFSSILQEWQNTKEWGGKKGKKKRKKNDTDYGRFMRVINTSSFMPLKTAFHQLLCRVSA